MHFSNSATAAAIISFLISPVNLLKFVDVQELNVPEKDVEQLLVLLILDNRIDGHIDQVNRLLERGDRSVSLTLHFLILNPCIMDHGRC